MCSGLKKSKLCSASSDMEKKNGVSSKNCSKLLELAAEDDVSGFIIEVEEKGFDLNEASFWYGRRIGFSKKKMGLEERTPLAISAMFGSIKVLKYILETGKVDPNAICGSDKVTALHCAVAGGSSQSAEAVKLLLSSSAATTTQDANGFKPSHYIPSCHKTSSSPRRRELSFLLNGSEIFEEEEETKPLPCERKEYPVDTSLPDINAGIYGTDDFRMYTFKVKPCSRAYSHDWTECPFVHPGENARRRDPTKYTYTCVPCPEFKKGNCGKGDNCEFAHGVFESWLHPAQYKTRLCKDETGCSRKVCFFAHRPDELRPLYPSTGSALPSPKSPSESGGAAWQSFAPPALQFSGSRLKTTLNARDYDPMEEMVGLSSPSRWNGLKPANLDELFASPDSRGRAHAAAVMNLRAASLRSQSFIDRGLHRATHSPPPGFSDWGSPDGKPEWGLTKSASFAVRSGKASPRRGTVGFPEAANEPDVSWVSSLVKDVPSWMDQAVA